MRNFGAVTPSACQTACFELFLFNMFGFRTFPRTGMIENLSAPETRPNSRCASLSFRHAMGLILLIEEGNCRVAAWGDAAASEASRMFVE
jgi:hypothetical protein